MSRKLLHGTAVGSGTMFLGGVTEEKAQLSRRNHSYNRGVPKYDRGGERCHDPGPARTNAY